MPEDQIRYWFSNKIEPVLIYKVNRRPMPDRPLFFELKPDDKYAHFVAALLEGEPVTKNSRTWLIGDIKDNSDDGVLSGSIGWESVEEEQGTSFNHETRSWEFSAEEHDVSAVSVFAYDGAQGCLYVLKHDSFAEANVAKVFTNLLNNGERHLEPVTTDWDVEPLLDGPEFFEWVRSVDQVSALQFVAKLPNPDPAEEFEEIVARMEALRAKLLREKIVARDAELGLENIQGDGQIRGYLAMADRGYGYVTAVGTKDDIPTKYDQRNKVKRVTVELPETWPELLGFIVAFAFQRRRDDN